MSPRGRVREPVGAHMGLVARRGRYLGSRHRRGPRRAPRDGVRRGYPRSRRVRHRGVRVRRDLPGIRPARRGAVGHGLHGGSGRRRVRARIDAAVPLRPSIGRAAHSRRASRRSGSRGRHLGRERGRQVVRPARHGPDAAGPGRRGTARSVDRSAPLHVLRAEGALPGDRRQQPVRHRGRRSRRPARERRGRSAGPGRVGAGLGCGQRCRLGRCGCHPRAPAHRRGGALRRRAAPDGVRALGDRRAATLEPRASTCATPGR